MFVELSFEEFIREYNAFTGTGGMNRDSLSALCNFIVYGLKHGRPDEDTASRIPSAYPGIGVLYVPRVVCGEALCIEPTVSSDYAWEYQGEDDAYLVFCAIGRVYGHKVDSQGGWRFKPPVPELESDD